MQDVGLRVQGFRVLGFRAGHLNREFVSRPGFYLLGNYSGSWTVAISTEQDKGVQVSLHMLFVTSRIRNLVRCGLCAWKLPPTCKIKLPTVHGAGPFEV